MCHSPHLRCTGVPLRPVPKAKRILASARCLPHIAQALMAGSPLLVDMCAALITELVRFNPAAAIKLYLTGVFYFAMAYAGSNWKCLCRLLYDTHLRQSFHADAATLTSEAVISKRSILGTMLPESMICVLVRARAAEWVVGVRGLMTARFRQTAARTSSLRRSSRT